MSAPASYSRRAQRGVSLIEVLIALVVISVGLLGLAGLQVTGLAYTHIAGVRSTAAVIVNNMAASMRSNPAGVSNQYYDNVDTQVVAMNEQSPSCRQPDSACTPEQVAQAGIELWARQVKRDLPGGRGTIECQETPCEGGAAYIVSVSWEERDFDQESAAGATVTRTFSTVLQP